MNILFLHRNFPAQFKHVIAELKKDSKNKIVFITANNNIEIPGIKKITYKVEKQNENEEYLDYYSDAIGHAKAAAEEILKLKEAGFIPDIIYGHDWGPTIFVKDIFPNVPFLCYFEWFYTTEGADLGFDGRIPNVYTKSKVRCKNSSILMNLCSCDAGIVPTKWQKTQFPNEFSNKLQVIYDGIDTNLCKPDNSATFSIGNLELSQNDEVITYTARGLEPYRGFPQLMMTIKKLQIIRPNVHFVIAGEDKAFYGGNLEGTTYKEFMLDKLNIETKNVHFVNTLPFEEYLKILQISSAHIYLTYPFVLSWSMLEAMACGCCIIASNTKPVTEIITDNINGLLADFYNIDEIVNKVIFALENNAEAKSIRQNARTTILEKYSLKKMLPKQINLINNLIKN